VSMDPRQVLALVLEEASRAGAAQADAFWEESESLALDVFEGRVQNLERSDSVGLGVRVLVDGRPGFSFTERMVPDAVRRCARDAVALSRFTDPLEIDLPAPWEPPEVDLGLSGPDPERFGPSRMLELCLEAESEARSADARVVNVPHLGATRTSGRTLLANSKGFLGERSSGSVFFGIGVVAREGSTDKMGWDGIGWRDPALLEPSALARKAVERAVDLLGASPIPSGPLPVLLDERVSAQFLSIFAGAFLADMVQKGQSRLVGRIGERVAPAGFRLSTQPLRPGMAGTRLFDAEGVPAKPRSLVEDGVLQGFLHNLETASRERAASTGDAVRSYSGRVSAGFSNLEVDMGAGRATSELLSAFPRLLHVVKLEGTTGCNPISGDVSIGVQGFLVEGADRRPVDRVSVSGNFFEMLRDLDAWGDRCPEGVRSQFVPALLSRSLRVAS
jgi:PmbA protein